MSVNLAPINDGKWHSDSSWSICPADNIYKDTEIIHTGAPSWSWRIENGPSLAADHEWGSLVVAPGDHVVMSVWVKTLGIPDPVIGRSGATVAMDMYTTNYNGTWARIGACNSPGFVPIKGNYGAGYPSDSGTWMVPWGNDWVQRKFDFIMPDLWWGDGGMPTNNVPRGTYFPPNRICPWLQTSANYGQLTGRYTTWFSDPQLYINSVPITKRRLTISKVTL
jgi:hypothetical protein